MLSDLAPFLDHTLLRPDATTAQVERLCAEALEHGFATVFVDGAHVARCAAALAGSEVRVGSVAGFPLGTSLSATKLAEATAALDRGAREIDVVQNVGALLDGDDELVRAEVAALAAACHEADATLKVILECCVLERAHKVRACELAVAAGADYVKTSTGFSTGGATAEDVSLLRATVGDGIGVKASGGIRDAATARVMLAAGASRIGTSSAVAIAGEG